MFTGLVEEIGIISQILPAGMGKKITIHAAKVTEDLHSGDSVNVSGVCQTVIHCTKTGFTVEAVEETLKKTNFNRLATGDKVNLERSLLPTTRMGGHFVSGHVDTPGEVSAIEKLSNSYIITVRHPAEFAKYIISVGSIAVDGISLTVAEKGSDWFKVAIIPHTWEVTTMKEKKTGSMVNLEFDLVGKYILNAVEAKEKPKLTEEWLKEQGF